MSRLYTQLAYYVFTCQKIEWLFAPGVVFLAFGQVPGVQLKILRVETEVVGEAAGIRIDPLELPLVFLLLQRQSEVDKVPADQTTLTDHALKNGQNARSVSLDVHDASRQWKNAQPGLVDDPYLMLNMFLILTQVVCLSLGIYSIVDPVSGAVSSIMIQPGRCMPGWFQGKNNSLKKIPVSMKVHRNDLKAFFAQL